MKAIGIICYALAVIDMTICVIELASRPVLTLRAVGSYWGLYLIAIILGLLGWLLCKDSRAVR